MYLLNGVVKILRVRGTAVLSAAAERVRRTVTFAGLPYSKDQKNMSMSEQTSTEKLPEYISMECSESQTKYSDLQDSREHIVEGKASILKEKSKNVFYNPVQEFNRDLSIAVLTVYAHEHFQNVRKQKSKDLLKKQALEKISHSADQLNTSDELSDEEEIPLNLEPGIKYEDGMDILEALAATGLRSIRYAKEVPGVKNITANDFSINATNSITSNIAHNKVEHLVSVSCDDASMVMYKHRSPKSLFNVIDLDPYGCPSAFLDGAVQAISDGGLLLVTCTDMAVLAGNTPESCYSKYGAMPLRNRSCHEMALRMVLQCIESHANRYGRYITPLLSVSVDFYIRLFVRVNTSPSMCKRSINKVSMVYQCVGCETLTLQPLGQYKNISADNPKQMKTVLPHVPAVPKNCPHCDKRHHMGGPMWSAPMHDKSFVSAVLDVVSAEDAVLKFGTAKRLQGMLSVVEEELDIPLYYNLPRLTSLAGVSTMPIVTFSSALLNAGYQVSHTHAKPGSVKTDAPPSVVWDIVRAWKLENPVGKKQAIEGSVSFNLLSKPGETKVNFSKHPDANPTSRQSKKCRFQVNPMPNWGPGVRSVANLLDGSIQDKQKRNQGKSGRKHKKRKRNDEGQGIILDTNAEVYETSKKRVDDSKSADNSSQA